MFTGNALEIIGEIIALLSLIGGFVYWLLSRIETGDDEVRKEIQSAGSSLRRDLDDHRAEHRAFVKEIGAEVDAVRAGCATRDDVNRLYDAVADVRDGVRQLMDHALGGQSSNRSRRRDDART